MLPRPLARLSASVLARFGALLLAVGALGTGRRGPTPRRAFRARR